MPTYAYACKDCGHAFDIVQSFSDASLTVCPECGGGLRKKFNSVGVVFKGSGFYRTDSRSSSTVSAGSTPAGASTGTTSGSTPSTSTPAAAPAPAASAPAASAAAN